MMNSVYGHRYIDLIKHSIFFSISFNNEYLSAVALGDEV